MKYWFLFLFIFILFVLIQGLSKDPTIIPSNLLSQKAPNFQLKKVHEYPLLENTDLKNTNGKPIILNFFASWCPPCKLEHPFLMELSYKYKIFGIAKKDNQEAIDMWFKKSGNPFQKIGLDSDGLVSIDWGVYGLPETFLLDAKGVIKYKHVGPITKNEKNNILKILKRIE